MGRDAVFKLASPFFIRHIAPYLRGCVFKMWKVLHVVCLYYNLPISSCSAIQSKMSSFSLPTCFCTWISHSSYDCLETFKLYLPTLTAISFSSAFIGSSKSCIRSSTSSKSQPVPSNVPVSFKICSNEFINLSSIQPPSSVSLLSAIR